VETAADANINERKYFFFQNRLSPYSRLPIEVTFFALHHNVQAGSAAQPAFFTMGIAGYVPWVKGAGSEAGYSFSCSLEVKNEWRDTYTLYCCKDKCPY